MRNFQFYYYTKKLIPRSLQIGARRAFLLTKKAFLRTRWPIDTRAVNRPAAFTRWPENKRFALVLRHDVETADGIRKCPDILSIERAFGFRSAFYLVPEDYTVDEQLRKILAAAGCEIGVHGLKHDGMLYVSRRSFKTQAVRINRYLREWDSVGFASPSSHHRFEWIHDLNLLYDTSSFDTDPFEPQPDGVRTIFPMRIESTDGRRSFIEIPYTMPQDFTLFVILREKSIRIWKRKLDWIAKNGGMAMVITHPDYMRSLSAEEKSYTYPIDLYKELLSYIEGKYHGQYWNALPREIARFWKGIVDV
jgi:peptidoglycan/xylan/chitin deacetylase (PgdA/CDA1 family)